MNNPHPGNYPHDIVSVRAKHPGLPLVLGTLDTNRAIRAGDPLDRTNLKQARSVVNLVKALKDDGHNLATDEVLESAELRSFAVQQAHAASEFAQNPNNDLPPALVHVINGIHDGQAATQQILMNLTNTMALIQQAVAQIPAIHQAVAPIPAIQQVVLNMQHEQKSFRAQLANLRILIRNSRIQAPSIIRPLQKTVGGSGRNLALTVIPDNLLPIFNDTVPANAEAAEIGTVPANFRHEALAYGDLEILLMIVHYNEAFGITANDPLETRVEKFFQFLNQF